MRVLERCDALAAISEEPGRLVRRFATPAMREAQELAAAWMREAGLETHEDAVGNLIGRRGTPLVALGSHLDTVVDAGRYDGPLGVVAAIEIAERLPDVPLEVISFADEEGVRYGTSFLGSSAVAGTFDPAQLALTDADGIAMRDLVGDPATAPTTCPPTSSCTSSRARCSSAPACRSGWSRRSRARRTPS